jgi:CoA:oxalate CoA-transferase
MTQASGLPLEGVTVVDLSRVLAGPFATLVLAQLGARVIKVEIPGRGDDARAFGPFVNGASLYFSSLNYDKESIALDLKRPADRATFEGLLGLGDVLVENFRPGTLDDLGYGWDVLHARFPRLIYAAVSGFGHSGPYSARGAYDMVVQGMGGIMSVTGHPGGPPTRVGVSVGDLSAGLYLVIGVLGALLKRGQTGAGVKVDVAMLDCQVALLENALSAYLATGKVAGPRGSRHPEIAPFQVFATQDGHAVIAAGNDRLFVQLCRALGLPHLPEDERYRTNTQRMANVDALQADLEAVLRTRPTAAWLELLHAAGVPCGPVNTVADVAKDPQVAAREMIVSIPDPHLGTLRVAGCPIKMSDTPGRTAHTPPPEIDRDREAILGMLPRESEER